MTNENKKIQYYIKNIYGNETIYLVDSKEKDLILRLTGRKSCTHNDFKALKEYGYILEQIIEPKSKEEFSIC